MIGLKFLVSLWQIQCRSWELLHIPFGLCMGAVSVLSCRQQASRVLGISPYYWGKRSGSGRWWTDVFLPCWTVHDHDKVSEIKGILPPLHVYLLLFSNCTGLSLGCFPCLVCIHPLFLYVFCSPPIGVLFRRFWYLEVALVPSGTVNTYVVTHRSQCLVTVFCFVLGNKLLG